MSKKILVDASHAEETRVAIVSAQNELLNFYVEYGDEFFIKNNIYTATITRVEESLQAAFIEYDNGKYGFLPFNEIHPCNFNLSKEKIDEILKENTPKDDDSDDEPHSASPKEVSSPREDKDKQQSPKAGPVNNHNKRYGYSINEVIKVNQKIIVQATKEERGNKNAVFTSYVSMIGRYCILMPYSTDSGGVSRKIKSNDDRIRLKEILSKLQKESDTQKIIIRTAGQDKSYEEIEKDYKIVYKLWSAILDAHKKINRHRILFQESDIVRRTIRDQLSGEDKMIISGSSTYSDAKVFASGLIPDVVDNIEQFTGNVPLYTQYNIENKVLELYDNTVALPSGGYLIIDHTEALTSIDVNSGKSTKTSSIEENALSTNIEAAYESMKQIRLRNISGLIVIDFIDMKNDKNNDSVLKKINQEMKYDTSKVQVGSISMFGLLEISRQRIDASIPEKHMQLCTHCHGLGKIRPPKYQSLQILRKITKTLQSMKSSQIKGKSICINIGENVGFYLLNHKREEIMKLEKLIDTKILVAYKENLKYPFYSIELENGESIIDNSKNMAQQEMSFNNAGAKKSGHHNSNRGQNNGPHAGNGNRRNRNNNNYKNKRRERTGKPVIQKKKGLLSKIFGL